MKCWRPLGTGTTLTSEAVEQLAQWVKVIRKDGTPATYGMLRIMALEAAIDLGLNEDQFRAGWHWVDRFKRRHGLSLRARTRVGQQTLEDGLAVLESFAKRIRQVVEDNDIQTIYNADQTAVNYEYLPTTTLNKSGDNTVWIKCGGKRIERMTAMVLADTTGKKHPFFLVLRTTKSKVKGMVEENNTLRHGTFMIAAFMETQLHGGIHHYPSSFLSTISASVQTAQRRRLLVWDDFSAHFTPEVLSYAEELNVVLERVPPSYTWLYQPADVAWNRPLKGKLRQMWSDSIRRQLLRSKHRGTPFKLEPPSRLTVVSWVTAAWSDIDDSTIRNGFLKCQIVDGQPAEDIVECVVVNETDMATLMATCSIEETIDPGRDFSTSELEEQLGSNVLV
ncbi:hypothetical protein AeRB84_005331 [Aphanomyces euteiches]|nr:hypothetical protein AeRB84_005331 [Aphanomyces euteiches]